MIYVGIDNGVSGAIALLTGGGNATVLKTPIVDQGGRSYIDVLEVRGILEAFTEAFVALEATQVNRIFGAKGNHSQGRSEGAFDAILKLLKIRHTYVKPKVWQNVMHEGVRRAGKDTKAASFEACSRLFPDVNLVLPGCRVKHDGCADALLIAEWARRQNL